MGSYYRHSVEFEGLVKIFCIIGCQILGSWFTLWMFCGCFVLFRKKARKSSEGVWYAKRAIAGCQKEKWAVGLLLFNFCVRSSWSAENYMLLSTSALFAGCKKHKRLFGWEKMTWIALPFTTFAEHLAYILSTLDMRGCALRPCARRQYRRFRFCLLSFCVVDIVDF